MEKIYLALIKKGLRTLESVPEYRGLRDRVKLLLDAEKLDGNGQDIEEVESQS